MGEEPLNGRAAGCAGRHFVGLRAVPDGAMFQSRSERTERSAVESEQQTGSVARHGRGRPGGETPSAKEQLSVVGFCPFAPVFGSGHPGYTKSVENASLLLSKGLRRAHLLS